MIDDEIIEEFKQETDEAMIQAESLLFQMETSQNYKASFQEIYRIFHSIKGGAGMMGFHEVQKCVHFLEGLLDKVKDQESLNENQMNYLLSGVDYVRSLLLNKDYFKFEYSDEHFIKPEVKVKNEALNQAAAKIKNESLGTLKGFATTISIYVVDDDDEVRETVCELLAEDLDYKFHEFASAPEAVEHIKNLSRHTRPHCIVSDFNMPQMNGLEFLKELREMDIHVPFLILSGYLDKQNCLKGIQMGASALIEKPFEPITLRKTVQSAVEKSLMKRLMHQSLKFAIYQFSDLEKALDDQTNVKKLGLHRKELESLLEEFRKFENVS